MAIVLLFGIPGSGKSTLARRLCDEFGRGGVILSFDTMARDIVWNETSFKSLRRESLATISVQARELAAQCHETQLAAPGMLVVDDIMYLCSMRREVYVIARNNGLPIITVWVNTELEEALRRNGQRDGAARIDDDAVRKIHAQMEPPNMKHICDRHSVTIDGNSEQSISNGISNVQAQMRKLWVLCQEERLVLRAMQESAEAHAQPGAGQQTENPSLVKDLDVALRNVVAFAMKVPEARANKPLAKGLGSSFAAAKAHTLHVAHRSAASVQYESVEQRAVWLRVHCEEFVSRAESSRRVDGEPDFESSACSVFDATRLYLVGKFDST